MRAGGSDGVENHGGRIRAGFLLYDFDAGAAGPDLELFDGGGAESVRGAEDDAGAFFFQAIGELADGGGFSGAVHADDEDYAGRDFREIRGGAGAVAFGVGDGGLQDFYDLMLEFFF